MIFIDEFQIAVAATYDKWINAMEEALSAISDGTVKVPKRTHIDLGKDALLLMPAIGKDYFATKLVSFFPLNRLEQKPSIYGTLILNDRKTGEPLAVIDGSKLTAMRTAAVSGIGVRYLSDEKASSIGIIGAGIQGFHQALFACSQREISKLYVYDNRRELTGKFCSELRKIYPRIKIAPSQDAKDLCEKSEIIITATNSFTPVLPSEQSYLKRKTIIAIGSYKQEMRELPDELFSLVDYVFFDTEHGLSESGDLIYPLNNGLIAADKFYPVYDLISGKVKPKSSTRLFKTVGFAAFDLYAAKLVYEASIVSNQY
jgi:ornithine cyclodeaminase/alanine dehydrogenase-like protein (mu-crystallin family)